MENDWIFTYFSFTKPEIRYRNPKIFFPTMNRQQDSYFPFHSDEKTEAQKVINLQITIFNF
jgi:hypothetical protein